MSDPIQSIARHLGIQTFGDGLLAKIGQTIDLLQEAARNRADLATECERLRDLLIAAQEKAGIYADLRDAALQELADSKKFIQEWCMDGAPVNAAIALENDKLRAELAALKGGQEAVAFRLLNIYGEVITEWEDGAPPENFVDLCGRPADDVRVELAYSAPPAQASAWGAEGLRVQVCKLGRLGAAFDPVSTRYAYTYTDQPDNVGAMKLGHAAAINAAKQHGDEIDRGLHLLLQLQAEGFGVYQLAAAPTPGASDGKGGDHE